MELISQIMFLREHHKSCMYTLSWMCCHGRLWDDLWLKNQNRKSSWIGEDEQTGTKPCIFAGLTDHQQFHSSARWASSLAAYNFPNHDYSKFLTRCLAHMSAYAEHGTSARSDTNRSARVKLPPYVEKAHSKFLPEHMFLGTNQLNL